MDVVRLGPLYSTDYQPDELIEGYTSMIFTERFQEYGDFELLTPKIGETLSLLPEGTLISHQESDDVHIVETHSIDEDEDGRKLLKVTGRSLDCFVDHRFVEAKYGKKRKMRRKYGHVGATAVLLWQAFDNGSNKDVTREGDWSWNDKDQIPNVAITDSATASGGTLNRWLVEGILGPQLKEILIKGDLGVRMIRPGPAPIGTTGTIVSVETALANRGDIVRTYNPNILALRFDIFDGIDRRSSVKFQALHGDLDKAQYLFSSQEYKTVVEIMSGIGGADQYRTGTEGLTGIQRRVASLDAGEPELDSEPERPKDPRKNATKAEKEAFQDALDEWRDDHAAWELKRDTVYAEFREDYLKDADRLLKDTRRVSMLSGDISPLAPYVFKRDYNLGDKVTLIGEYGQQETMVVSEYIRSEDETNGDRGYPGLIEP